MTRIFIYIIGFLLGFFIILNIISYKKLIHEYFAVKEKFSSDDTVKETSQDQRQKPYEQQQKESVSDKAQEQQKESTSDKVQEQQKESVSDKVQEQQKEQDQVKIDKQSQEGPTGKNTEQQKQGSLPNSQKYECSKDIMDDFTIYKLLNKKELVILISSYNETNLSNTSWKSDNNNKHIILNHSIQKERFALNPNIKGYNIKDVSLSGPDAGYLSSDKIINSMTLLYMMNIKDLNNKYNYLFELKCKPTYDFDKITKEKIYFDNDIYILIKDHDNLELSDVNKDCDKDQNCRDIQNKLRRSIHIHNSYYFYDKETMNKDKEYIEKCKADPKCNKLMSFDNELQFFDQLLDTKIYTIEIKVGQDIFHIHNINSSIFKNDLTFIYFMIETESVKFCIDNRVYNFSRNKSKDLYVDDDPFIINENGGCNMTLYSFAFFNTAICDYDISAFKLYNYHYLYGANKIEEDKRILTNANKELINRLKAV